MDLGDVVTLGLILLALWVLVVERYTPLRLEDGVRLGAAAVRAAWRRVSPLVRWVAYDLIIGRPTVKHTAQQDPDITSSGAADDRPSIASAAQTDGFRPAQTAPDAEARRAAMLDILRLVRGAGYGREEARALLRALGLPLDNNLWSAAAGAAAPPEAEVSETPIAGRETAAKFPQPAAPRSPSVL